MVGHVETPTEYLVRSAIETERARILDGLTSIAQYDTHDMWWDAIKAAQQIVRGHG